MYSPKTGRFTTEDQIHDGYNWDTYCGGNPVGYKDPTGNWMQGDDKISFSQDDRDLMDYYGDQWNASVGNPEEQMNWHMRANDIRAKYISSAIFINAEDAVDLFDKDIIQLGHNAVILITDAKQGLYFSFAAGPDSPQSYAKQLLYCQGMVSFRFLTPDEMVHINMNGKPIYNKMSDGTERSGISHMEYTSYLKFHISHEEGRNMYNKAVSYYFSPPEYSGLFFNCSNFAVKVLWSGNNKRIRSALFCHDSALPNTAYSLISKFARRSWGLQPMYI